METHDGIQPNSSAVRGTHCQQHRASLTTASEGEQVREQAVSQATPLRRRSPRLSTVDSVCQPRR